MSDLKAVFFDLDDTLWDRSGCARQVMDIVLPELMPHLPEEDPEEVVRRFNAVLLDLPHKEDLRERRPFSLRRRFEALLQSYNVRRAGLAGDMSRRCDHTRRFSMRQFVRGAAVPVLQELGRMGLKRGLIINGPPAAQRHLVSSLGLEPHMDHVILAEAEGYSKPDVRVFRRALQLAGTASVEMLYVGDSPVTDVLGAARAGIRTVWYRTGRRRIPKTFPTPDYTITDLHEVLSIL
jgi:putative hydrolase of the HAD superfamily